MICIQERAPFQNTMACSTVCGLGGLGLSTYSVETASLPLQMTYIYRQLSLHLVMETFKNCDALAS
jgi:hypothetical protein